MLRRFLGRGTECRFGESSKGKVKSELKDPECRRRGALFVCEIDSELAEKGGGPVGGERDLSWSGLRDMSILSMMECLELSVNDRSCEILSSRVFSSAVPLALSSICVSRGARCVCFDARSALILFVGV